MTELPKEYTCSSLLSLISEIHADVSGFLKDKLSERGLPHLVSSHGNILFQLSRCEKMTMKDLSRAINRDKSTTTALIKKLSESGYVDRFPCPDDSRSTFISLSENGRRLMETTGGISRDLLGTSLRGFSDTELNILLDLLIRLKKNVSCGAVPVGQVEEK